MFVVKLCAFLFSFAGFLLLFLAVFSRQWIVSKNVSFGLWIICFQHQCHSHGKRVAMFIQATQAFILIATVLSFISNLGYFFSFYIPRIGSASLLRMSSIPSFLAGFFTLIAMIIFLSAEENLLNNRGVGLSLVGASAALHIISGLLASKTESAPKEIIIAKGVAG